MKTTQWRTNVTIKADELKRFARRYAADEIGVDVVDLADAELLGRMNNQHDLEIDVTVYANLTPCTPDELGNAMVLETAD